jgi:four helix bundle protein
MQRFTDLKVWQRSHVLVLQIYRLATSFPRGERFGLTSQLQRAAISVPKRRSNDDFARFLNIAEGSLAETEYLVMLARDLSFLPTESSEPLLSEIDEIARMLYTLRLKVEHSGR